MLTESEKNEIRAIFRDVLDRRLQTFRHEIVQFVRYEIFSADFDRRMSKLTADLRREAEERVKRL